MIGDTYNVKYIHLIWFINLKLTYLGACSFTITWEFREGFVYLNLGGSFCPGFQSPRTCNVQWTNSTKLSSATSVWIAFQIKLSSSTRPRSKVALSPGSPMGTRLNLKSAHLLWVHIWVGHSSQYKRTGGINLQRNRTAAYPPINKLLVALL